MASEHPTTYRLTVRPHRSADGCYEYVLSRPGSTPLMSEATYPTYEAAREAGHRRGQAMGLTAAPSAANG